MSAKFTKNLLAEQSHICKPFELLLLSRAGWRRRTGHCIHPPPPFLFYLLPGQDILKEVQGVRSMEDGGVCVCGHVRVCEARAAGSPSSHFMLRGTLLSRSGALKPLKFINMFKLFQGFFTDTPPPHHQLLHLHLHLLLQHNNTPFLMD